MLVRLHSEATTTPKIRAEIQASNEAAWVLADRHGISEQTVYKWRHRDGVEDKSHTPHRLAATMPSACCSWRRYFSNSAKTPSMSKKALPVNVDVSMGCSVAARCAPLDFRCVTMTSRSLQAAGQPVTCPKQDRMLSTLKHHRAPKRADGQRVIPTAKRQLFLTHIEHDAGAGLAVARSLFGEPLEVFEIITADRGG